MCGFAAIFNNSDLEHDSSSIIQMLDTILHRGPDNRSIFQDQIAQIGFQRLAIIDLDDSANQPMEDKNGRYVIAFNGEIYNYKQLRFDLEQQGYNFRTNSDTEVLLQMFIHKREDCLPLLNGMFAFLIYDKKEKSIFLARDRVGKKPLFYTIQNKSLYLASELKALLTVKELDRKIDEKMICQYLALGYNLAPKTIFKHIEKLKPAHYIEFNLNESKEILQKSYWDTKFSSPRYKGCIKDLEDEFHTLLSDSIHLRLQSDVPLAVFLSGGLDSSAITSILASSKCCTINAFTADFDNKQLSELDTVKSLLKKYPGINHHVLEIRVQDMLNNLWLLEKLDEPFSDSSFIPTFWISKSVKESGFTVALSGDGGDELLAGYFKGKPFNSLDYWSKISNNSVRFYSNLLSRSTFLPDKIKEIARRLSLNRSQYYWYTRSAFKYNQWKELLTTRISRDLPPDILYNEIFIPLNTFSTDATMNVFENGDFNYRLPDDFLAKVDRASMLNSLEVRNPFLDFRLVELLKGIPKCYKIKNGQTKFLLRDMLKRNDLVSNEVLSQKKMGFSIPLREWVHRDLRKSIKSVINDGKLCTWIDQEGLNSYFKKGEESSMHNSFTETIWRLYILSIYLNKHNLSL
jgi:asparagine synthase (glutamine-hydrolysing)